MKVSDIEIPYEKDRNRRYRFFEMLPGLVSWTVLALPFLLSLVNPKLTVFFVIAYLLLWFVKAIGMNMRAVQGWRTMGLHKMLNWQLLLDDLEKRQIGVQSGKRPDWHHINITRAQKLNLPVKPSDVLHVVMIATYKEAREVLEPTIQSVIASDYNMDKVILVLAYEGRAGEETEKRAEQLIKDYKGKFLDAFAVKHPETPGEVLGKGGNITYAARKVEAYLTNKKVDPINVILTTLDSDNRPHASYLAALTYTYCMCPEPKYVSFQPIPLYTNNIWDAPAPMRVVATGNSFWQTIVALRPHILRNFSAHAQSMQTLIETNYWSVRTVVEDGHQFWRTYFRYDGRHEVYPIFLPIYQDAVFVGGYVKTLKAQFIQMQRWAWGASDIAYVVDKLYFSKNKIPKREAFAKLARLFEGHISWATSALIITFSAFIPALVNPKDYSANQLPVVVSRMQTIAMAGIIISLFFSIKTLPPRPERYKAHRNIFMILQWLFLPVTTIVYSGLSALNSQTRLIFGKYLDKFDVTEKAVKTHDNKTVV